MKQISCMLLSFVLLCSLCVPAFALGTAEASGKVTISAEVPSSHKVTVQTDGGAAVIYGEHTVNEFDAPRFGTPTITIRAQNGKQIKSVLLNGTEISDKLQGGKYTFSPICEEQALVVITEND
ncbi:MAG: hypothetical protein GX851_02825, partial [Clostridiales bacterium]|nr:hypothetical protein [Clostridiales bacterium]